MPLTPYSFDNPDWLLQMLGSYWFTWFQDRISVREILAGYGELQYQAYLDMLDCLALTSKFTAPVFRKKNWHAFKVLESERFDESQLNLLYGTSNLEYANSLKPAYGDKEDTRYFSYAIPEDIQSVHAIYNRLLDPSLVWMEDQDFLVDADRHAIHFYTDPFENPLVPKRDVLDDDGNVVDREYILWFNMSEWDHNYIYTQFGYAIKIWMKSSTFYRDFVSAIWDHLVVGPTKAYMKLALTAMTGIPFALESETVLRVIEDGKWKHVETDKNLYTFKSAVTITVAAGDSLRIGDPMCNSVLVIEPTAGTDWTGIIGAAVNERFFRIENLDGPIVFENQDVSVDYVGIDAGGKAVVQFEVSGFSEDISSFWNQVHTNGIALGKTVAELLDTRPNPTGQPKPQDLPETINPFQFLMDNIFSNNLFLITLRPDHFANGAPGLQGLEYLYKYLVAQSTYLIFVEMSQGTDYYSIGDSEDDVTLGKAVPPLYDWVDLAYDKGPTFRVIKENCR